MDSQHKAYPILSTLLMVQRKYEKDYCWPSQMKIIKLMGKWQRIKKSRSTLNRWLRVCEDNGYLKRRRRIKKSRKYGIIFKSTLYKITIKGYRVLGVLGVDVKKEIEKFNKWKKGIKDVKGKGGISGGRDGELGRVGFNDIIKGLRLKGVVL